MARYCSKFSDAVRGLDGISVTHKWDGKILTITSASGTSEIPLGSIGGDGVGADLSIYAKKDDLNTKQDILVSGSNIKTINGRSLLGPGNLTVEGGGNGDVDLSDYVTKDGLKTINGQSILGSGDIYIGGGDDVDHSGYALKTEVEAKQDILISGSNIKTINGQSIMGSGDVTITGGGGGDVDPSDYATKTEVEAKQDELISGVNIKTINGVSILGGGNIVIEGGETSAQADYVAVKYLENTGTQWIDTNYVLNEDDVIEVDYEIPESALSIKNDKILIDARDSSNGVRVSTYSGTYKWYARFGHNESKTSGAITSSLKGTLSLSKGQFILNGAVIFKDMVFTAMPTGTLKLLAGVNYETGAISAPSYARISNVKIKRDGETIRNFRPVQRTADGELGMRDTVTSEFFANAGTGVFGYAPADQIEANTVIKKPTLTEEQKLAIQSLMDDYYNNKGTFYYEFTHNRNAYTSGGTCYTSAKSKFKMCCATFVQNIMMGRSVNDFVGKTGSTYSSTITKTDVSGFGYYFDFKYRKYLYGITEKDESGNFKGYYGWNQPNEDNYEGSYSYNSYYSESGNQPYSQNFNGFCNANDMARELYEMGCEIPFSELDIGDIVFTYDNDLGDNSSMFNFHAWRNIYHVAMVYDVKQIDASSKELYFIECTSYFDVDNRPIEKPYLSSAQMDLRFKGFKLLEDMVFCARMPVAFGYEPNVPDRITTSATP